MAEEFEAQAYMVRALLDEDGLTLMAANSAAALALTGDRRRRTVVLHAEETVAVRVTWPAMLGFLNGFVDISSGGAPYRVHFRKGQVEGVRELLRRMALAGFPAALEVGQRQDEDIQTVWDDTEGRWKHV
jgi:hypothetical protein